MRLKLFMGKNLKTHSLIKAEKVLHTCALSLPYRCYFQILSVLSCLTLKVTLLNVIVHYGADYHG